MYKWAEITDSTTDLSQDSYDSVQEAKDAYDWTIWEEIDGPPPPVVIVKVTICSKFLTPPWQKKSVSFAKSERFFVLCLIFFN